MRFAKSTATTAVRAAEAAGTKRAVVLSSVGAQHDSGVGPVSALHPVEQAFLQGLEHVTVLRPAFFMENFLRDLPTIAGEGKIYSPVPSDVAMPLVATRDVAAHAARALMGEFGDGRRFVGVHGPEDLSYAQAAEIIGEAVGRPVQHVQIDLVELRGALEGQGAPSFVVDLFVQMFEGALAGKMVPAEPRSEETTTKTDLAAFARDTLAPAVQAAR